MEDSQKLNHGIGIGLIERAIYRGANIYSRRSVVRVRIDLGELEEYSTNNIDGFTVSLLGKLPGLKDHHCSLGRSGGFVERLNTGTWLGHVVEHVALELQSLAGANVSRGKTRSVPGAPGQYDVMFEYRDERSALLAGLHALELVTSLLPHRFQQMRGLSILPSSQLPSDAGVVPAVEEIRLALNKSKLGPSTQAIVDQAKRRNIPVLRINDMNLLQLGYGSAQKRIRASITGETSHVAVEIAGNKQLTRQLLRDAGLPAPRGAVARTFEEIAREAARLAKPLVVKPLDANHGRGITLNIVDEAQLATAFEAARAHSHRVIVEEQVLGDDHRLLVVGGKMVAAARRMPALVVGDGVSDIATLVERENADPRRGVGHENSLTRLTIDASAERVLASQGLDTTSIPVADRQVRLRDTANLSTGGTAEDCTDRVHPDNVFVVEQAAAAVGLDIAGIDFLSSDITRPVAETGGGIVEVNAAPGLRMHLTPSIGEPRDVASPIVDLLFTKPRSGRIPIVAITGTNGKSTTARMVARVLREDGKRVGLTTTSGIYIADRLVRAADASGPKSARTVLANPTVDVAVLETARGGILREGLGFDRCDVGCVLNVTEDHMGLRGIDTVDDLAKVKAVVVRAVSRRGVSVLNADDPLTVKMARHAGGRVCWFSMQGCRGLVEQHVADGGAAVVREADDGGQRIVLYRDGARHDVMDGNTIPATFNGAAAFNIENALAASAITAALGVRVDVIAAALSDFSSSFEQNPARLNIVDRHGVTAIVDYAHNPAAVVALGKFLDTLRKPGLRMIGAFSTPGDRRDEDLIGMGSLAASMFDELIFRETPDGRGRPRGEINALMSQGALAAGLPADCVHRIVDEGEATLFALRRARPGDIVVLSPSQVDLVWQIVSTFEPEHAD